MDLWGLLLVLIFLEGGWQINEEEKGTFAVT